MCQLRPELAGAATVGLPTRCSARQHNAAHCNTLQHTYTPEQATGRAPLESASLRRVAARSCAEAASLRCVAASSCVEAASLARHEPLGGVA